MTGPRLAGWGDRAGAAMLDMLVVAAPAPVLAITGMGAGPLLLTLFAAACVYTAATMARPGAHNGQTLGKQTAAIRVVRDDGRPVTARTVLERDVAGKLLMTVATLGLNYLWPLGEREQRTLHDLAVRTHVVTVPPPQPAPPLAPALARYVYAAQAIEAGIAAALRQARLPYGEVCAEVSSLVELIWRTAQRAQLLYTALAQRPVASLDQRLAELEGTGKDGLVAALQSQLPVQRRMQAQLEQYEEHLERVVVELDTLRGHLLSVAASSDAFARRRVTERVRELRDEMDCLATGVREAYG